MRNEIPQEEFFDGSGFEKHESSQGDYYQAPNGRCYRVSHYGGWYVPEYAEDIVQALDNSFQGIGLVEEEFPSGRILYEVTFLIQEHYNDQDTRVSLQELKRLLFHADLAELCHFPLMYPSDEYDSEAERIYERLKNFRRPPSTWEIACTVKDVFGKMLGDHDDSNILHLAYAIKTGKVHPCPVCGKVYFWTPAEFDICPVCGWEDDNLQYIKPWYSGGANILSARQAQLEFSLREHEDTQAWLMNREKCFLDEYFEMFHQIRDDLKGDERERPDHCRERYIRDMIHMYCVEILEYELTDIELKDREEELFDEIMAETV